MKIKDMKRSDWFRCLERTYNVTDCVFQGTKGVISVLHMKNLTAPLFVPYEGYGKLKIADIGYSWVQLALEGKYYWLTAMFDEKDEFLEMYYDITAGTDFSDRENPNFRDMYLDIAVMKDGTLHELDRDELDEALLLGDITKEEHEKAIQDCAELYAYLETNKEEIKKYCAEYLRKLKLV